MKETGMIFSAEMVRAILAGQKTQTRRIVKEPEFHLDIDEEGKFCFSHDRSCGGYCDFACASEGEVLDGHIGWTPWGTSPSKRNRLYVKETWAERSDVDRLTEPAKALRYCLYKADDENGIKNAFHGYNGWQSSRHMPRLYSRISLEITSIRVEQVQGISRGDVMEEGCPFPNLNGKKVGKTDPVGWYRQKWNEINGKDSWDSNPWVWVISFKRIEQPR